MSRSRSTIAAMLGSLALFAIGACFPEIGDLETASADGGGGHPDAAAGGSDSGGTDSGGTDSGGSDSGGSDSGGSDSGGSDSGGSDSGGTDSGGSDSGGTDSGGTDSGGSDSGGTDGGTDAGGDAGAAGSGGSEPCPADMVHAEDTALGVSFCVDRTEVTQTQYIAFLMAVSSDPAQTEQPPACAFNTKLTNTPDGSCPNFSTGSDVPVYCVDWCDAYAYCAFRGKRLCGALDGGSLALGDPLTSDAWQFACTGGFKTTYPYGNDPIVGACNIPKENTPQDPSDDNQKAPVGSFPECEGGFPEIFDMQGNVAEWTDRCEPGDGTGDEQCMTRGGHTYGSASYWRCNNLVGKEPRNNADGRQTGIRCCGDAQTN